MSIKQVWEIIKDYQCSELQMVQNPALAVWTARQSEIDQLKAEKVGLEKAIQDALSLLEKWAAIEFEKTTHWSEGYEEGCLHCSLQLGKALRVSTESGL